MTDNIDPEKREFTIAQAAGYLNCNYYTILRWIANRWIVPDVKLPSGRVRFYQETLDATRQTVEKVQIETPAQSNRRARKAKIALYKAAGLPLPEEGE